MKGLPLQALELTIAYEPVWAIGKEADRAATAEEAQEMHEFIRSLLDAEHPAAGRIIYGGNVKVDNAKGLFERPDMDGGLVGGASLEPGLFREIVEIASRLSLESGNCCPSRE
jgi:triosephosphate isomerase